MQESVNESTGSGSLHLAVAMRGPGWHPAAWRTPAAERARLSDAAYWAGLAIEAERARLDFLTFEDSLGRPAGGPWLGDQIRGRLGAVLLAARVAPLARRIGLMPTVTTGSAQPYHLAQALATLDHVSGGRAGWQVRMPATAGGTGSGRCGPRALARVLEEAAEVVEAARRLWDGSGGFTGRWVKVSGSSTVPRPPQGRPVVAVPACVPPAYRFAARSADIVWVTPRDKDEARSIVAQVRAAESEEGRDGHPLRVYADLTVFSDPVGKARLDELDGAAYTSDAAVFTGPPERLADLLLDWRDAGLDGFRLCPGVIPLDLTAITRGLVPELRRRGAFRDEYEPADLRGRLRLGRPRCSRRARLRPAATR